MTSPVQANGERHVGVTGLAVMGQNLARNIARRGFPVAVHNRTSSKVDELLARHGDEGDIVGCHEVADFVAALAPPRLIVIMVKAGAPVDDVIEEVVPHLDRGDVLVDGGNSDFEDSARRCRDLAERGVEFLGCGISGGEEGALHGPSLMPGGSRAAYEIAEELLTSIAAQVDGSPCCTFIGSGGAGHYVKMVHNGIEYADMQLIAETYEVLGSGLGLDNDTMADIFDRWNQGELDSYLIGITAQVLRRRDDLVDDDAYLIDRIVDSAGQKGTGRLTAIDSYRLGSPSTVIAEAVHARSLSALTEERRSAAEILPSPPAEPLEIDVDELRGALYAAKIVAYAQGFDQLRRGSEEHGWDLHLDDLATIWRGGCIIRARFLDVVRDAYRQDGALTNLVLAPSFVTALREAQPGWRRVVARQRDGWGGRSRVRVGAVVVRRLSQGPFAGEPHPGPA